MRPVFLWAARNPWRKSRPPRFPFLERRGRARTLTGIAPAGGWRHFTPANFENVAKVLRLSRRKTLFKVFLPAAMPYIFTGFRLSLGIAWLVIVAVEMLTGTPGVGGFLWQEYNSLIYEHILLCILPIGAVGFILDRLMSVIEARFKTA